MRSMRACQLCLRHLPKPWWLTHFYTACGECRLDLSRLLEPGSRRGLRGRSGRGEAGTGRARPPAGCCGFSEAGCHLRCVLLLAKGMTKAPAPSWHGHMALPELQNLGWDVSFISLGLEMWKTTTDFHAAALFCPPKSYLQRSKVFQAKFLNSWVDQCKAIIYWCCCNNLCTVLLYDTQILFQVKLI